MYKYSILLGAMILLTLFASGCSDGGNPIVPLSTSGSAFAAHQAELSQTNLWGYYDINIDIKNETVDVVFDRTAMFTCNTVNFLNNFPVPPLTITINDLIMGSDYMDIDVDVTLTHPFPGMPQFHGYDVRGIFMGDGSRSLDYNSDLIYPVFGTDQFMFANPDGVNGAPDGYSRWFNITEFADPEIWMFGYTPGNMAPTDFAGTATLCPYKYFADGLETNEDLSSWIEDHPNDNGQFSSGATNTRNYYLRFPDETGLMFGYAVIADWKGPEPEDHPSNAPEVVACDVDNDSTVYYIDENNKGGDLIFDITLYGWGYQPPAIFIESTVLTSTYEFSASEMTPVGGGETCSTYHVEIPADNIMSNENNEYWIISHYDDFDYTNEFGFENDAWEDSLAACFRFDLPVGDQPRMDIYVDGDNDSGIENGTKDHPYDTIMEAIDAAPAYSLVHVDAVESGDGYYEESVNLKTDVWLHGDNWNGGEGKPEIHINGSGGWHAVVPHMEGIDVSLIEIDNFELTSNHFEIEWWGGSGNNSFQLLRFKNASDITVRNCRFSTSVSATGVAAVRMVDGSNIIFEHNELLDISNTRDYNWSVWTLAIFAWNIQDLVLRQNEIHHLNYQSTHNAGDAFITRTYGISCLSCDSGLEITNNLIYDIYDLSEGDASNPQPNYYRSNEIHGIFLQGCPGAFIANNTLDDFNPVARSGSQAGKVRGIYCGQDSLPADSIVVNNNITSNMVATELTSQSIFYGAGFYGVFPFTVDYSNVYNLDLTNGGAEYYGLAVKGTGSFDNADMQNPNYDMTPGPAFYHVQNPALVSDDGSEMGAFGGPGGNWIPPSQE